MLASPTSTCIFRIIILLCAIIPFSSTAQSEKDTLLSRKDLPFIVDYRPIQISIWPGLGDQSGEVAHFANDVSLNLLYGLSGANYALMYSSLINRNLYYASGLQISGIFNQIRRSEYAVKRDLYEASPILEMMEGVQMTGGINFVGNSLVGAQLAGFYNNVLKDTKGLQLALIGNRTGRNFRGVQVASLLNIAIRNASGYQVGLGINFTQGDLRGLQLGLYNRARRIPRSYNKPLKRSNSVQIGIVNTTKLLAGYQIGVVNITRKFYGTQIGIVNIYKKGPNPGDSADKYGSAFGLINVGTGGGLLAFYTDELLMLGTEITTGNCTNCKWSQSSMPLNDRFMKYTHNAIVLQYRNPPQYYLD
jgi:hypothetical protein